MQFPLDDEIASAFKGSTTSEHGMAQAQGILTHRLSAALASHATALKDAAKASDKYARRLLYATWALVAATLVLVYATFQLN